MKQSRFTDEQIIGFLKQADAGMSVKELCRSGGFSQPTFYKWRSRFGGMEPSDVAKLRELEAKKNERANALKEVKRLCKEFGFTASMLKGSLAEGRKAKEK